ncbi:oligosaccharide flippase family protein [Paenibacillus sp. FSL K6-1217]|uniref:oligosaccharide flippase family protein n=1 Tax=Paenibacillus sp. FSL K6-1217 TaxID=2921466 RepID=UPI003245B7EE
MNQLKVGAILSYFSILVSVIISFLYTPVMLRLLGQQEFGLYSLIGSIISYLSILDMGLGNAVVKYTSQNRALNNNDAQAKLNGMFLIIYTIIGLITLIIGYILYCNINNIFDTTLSQTELEKAKVMVLLLVFNFSISFPLGVFGSILQAYEKFVFLRVTAIIRTITNPLLVLPLLFWGYGAISIVVVNTILNVVFLIFNIYFCFKKIKIKFDYKEFNFKLLKEISSYSFFIFLSVIVDRVYWSTGQLILGAVSGTLVVAIYAITMQLTNMYMMLSTSVGGMLLPKISMMVINEAKDKEYSNLMIKVGRLQFVIMGYILSGIILFGKVFINMWAGPNYTSAYYFLLIILIPLTIPLIQNVGLSILQAKSLHGFRSIVLLAVALFNVIISIPLAKYFGGYGCAIATGISLFIGNVLVMNTYYHRKVKIDISEFWKNIGYMTIPILISLICGTGINYLIDGNSLTRFILKVVIYSLMYFCFMWNIGLNKYERNVFLSPFQKVYRKISGNNI